MDYGSILWEIWLLNISVLWIRPWANQNHVFWNIKLFLWELMCIKHFYYNLGFIKHQHWIFCWNLLYYYGIKYIFNSSVVVEQWLSYVQLFATPWTAAHQAPLSFTVSGNLLTFMSIESVILSNHLLLCHTLLLLHSVYPSISLFQWVSSSHQVAKVFELQRQFLQPNPRDCSLPGSSVHGIPRQEMLECVAIPVSRASSWTKELNPWLCVSWIGRQIFPHCATWEVQ